jgi:hypothetical protein
LFGRIYQAVSSSKTGGPGKTRMSDHSRRFAQMIKSAPLAALVLILVLLAYCTGPALAYLDLGSGSFIFQMIVAGLLSAGFFLKVYWKKVTRFFRPSSKNPESDTDDDE